MYLRRMGGFKPFDMETEGGNFSDITGMCLYGFNEELHAVTDV
jgi:hypothetical protein